MAENSLSYNTSKILTFEVLVTKLSIDTYHEKEMVDPPQQIKPSYKCDTKIPIESSPEYHTSWEICTYEGGTDQQYYMILSIECESVEKPRRNVAKKGARVFSTPRKPNQMSA